MVKMLLAGTVTALFSVPPVFGAPLPPVTVVIEGFQFTPPVVTLSRGQTVRFLNRDSTPHTVAPGEGAGFAGTGRLLSGESRSFTFAKIGSYSYFCEYHTTMTGKLIVR